MPSVMHVAVREACAGEDDGAAWSGQVWWRSQFST